VKTLVKADWIVTPSGEVIKNGCVVVVNGKVDGYFDRIPQGNFQREIKVNGYLYPPFVNAHVHMELSLLSFNPDEFASFFDWLLWIIGKRSLFTRKDLELSLKLAEEKLISAGTYYVGDISSFGVSSFWEFRKIKAVVFSEFIGKEFSPADFRFPVSAHSVYSVSFGALSQIARESSKRELKFQLHLGETFEEEKFVRCERNQFEEKIYPFIGRKRYERVCANNLIEYLKRAEALNENLIAVHCTNLSLAEMEEIVKAKASVVFCPRSNLHLKVGFPKVEYFIGYEKLALATDGLSSNLDLSVVEELKAVYYKCEGRVKLKDLLPLITSSAAKVLGISDYGEKVVFTVSLSEASDLDPYSKLLDGSARFQILDLSESL